MSESSDSTDDYDNLRKAVFEIYESEERDCKNVAKQFGVTEGRLRRAFKAWPCTSEAQPQSWVDVHFDAPHAGMPCKLGKNHEEIISQAIRHYAANKTPLSKHGLRSLVKYYVRMLSEKERTQIGFKNDFLP